jgi:nucleotide-binding universal stress UspA family protein
VFKRILFATDFSEHAEIAKKVAVDLAKGGPDKHLWVLTVLEPVEEPLWPGEEPPGVSTERWKKTINHEIRELEEEKARKLEQDIADIKTMGIPVTKLVREGDPAEEIVKAAKEVDADVIVMGTHSNRSIWDVLLGSVTEKVVKNAPCPVVAVSRTPQQSKGEKGPFLLVTDFSDASEKAVKVAASLAKEQKTKLIVLTVMGRGLGKRVAQLGLEHLVEELRSQGLDVEGMIRKGQRGCIYPQIVEAAKEVGASVIIMGSHSRLTVYDVLLGYVAENVSKHAPCPVLIVSDRSAE